MTAPTTTQTGPVKRRCQPYPNRPGGPRHSHTRWTYRRGPVITYSFNDSVQTAFWQNECVEVKFFIGSLIPFSTSPTTHHCNP
jgi:hypothetical protein